MNEVEKSVDPRLWHACAGGMIQMPLLNSHVYYFPQGHAEHTNTNVDFAEIPGIQACIFCKVIDVNFMVHIEQEEVYAKIRLSPVKGKKGELAYIPSVSDQLTYFAKPLTFTDANSGHIRVPRHKAEAIFPEMDYSQIPARQTVIAKDIHGEDWEFLHVSRGTHKMHLLTAGWTNFRKNKKLVKGNSVVFTCAENGDVCVGIMRDKVKDINSSGRGQLRTEDVIKAASLAVNGQEFEITYYPRVSSPEFVVKAFSVDAALRLHWGVGMRVKMALETGNSSEETWLVGDVSSVKDADTLNWHKSPWRCLEVNWAWGDVLYEKTINPWMVEVVESKHSSSSNKIRDKRITEIFDQPIQREQQQVKHNLCRVFLESDDYCYGTLDLSATGSYEEVQKTLKDWFDIKKFDLIYMIYYDSEGVEKIMGEEPYSEFMKAKKLTVIGDVSDHDE